MDPYRGKQEQKPETEAMDLPEEFNLDQDEPAGQDEEGDGEDEGQLDEETTFGARRTESMCTHPL